MGHYAILRALFCSYPKKIKRKMQLDPYTFPELNIINVLDREYIAQSLFPDHKHDLLTQETNLAHF